MDFNFVDDIETQEDEDEFLDLSDLFDEGDEDEELEVAGYSISFENEVPEAMSITDPEVKKRALKARKKKTRKQYDKKIGSNKPYVHGLCKSLTTQSSVKGKLVTRPPNHKVCKQFEEWNVRAGIPCACKECDHPMTLEDLTNGKNASKTTSKSRGQRVRPEPESLSGSNDEGFVLVLD